MSDGVGEPREPVEGGGDPDQRQFNQERSHADLLKHVDTKEEAEGRRRELIGILESRAVEPTPEQLVRRYTEAVNDILLGLERNFHERRPSPTRSQVQTSLQSLLRRQPSPAEAVVVQKSPSRVSRPFDVRLLPPYRENPGHNEREYALVRADESSLRSKPIQLLRYLADKGRQAMTQPEFMHDPELIHDLRESVQTLQQLAEIFDSSERLTDNAYRRLDEIERSLEEGLELADEELHRALTEAFRRSGDDVMARQRTVLEDIEEKLIYQRRVREDQQVRTLLDRYPSSESALSDDHSLFERRLPSADQT